LPVGSPANNNEGIAVITRSCVFGVMALVIACANASPPTAEEPTTVAQEAPRPVGSALVTHVNMEQVDLPSGHNAAISPAATEIVSATSTIGVSSPPLESSPPPSGAVASPKPGPNVNLACSGFQRCEAGIRSRAAKGSVTVCDVAVVLSALVSRMPVSCSVALEPRVHC
jgi:hypothetical protein